MDREQWAKARGLTPSRKGNTWRDLFDGRTREGGAAGSPHPPAFGKNGYPHDLFPGEDHPRLFDRDGKPAVFTFQPYHLSLDELRGIVNTCDAYGLDVRIRTHPAWHLPGHVLFVEITRRATPAEEWSRKCAITPEDWGDPSTDDCYGD